MARKILVVEGDSLVRRAIATVLGILFDEQLSVIDAEHCDAAAEMLVNQSDVDLLLCGQHTVGDGQWGHLLSAAQSLRLPVLIFPVADEYDVFIKALGFGVKGYFSGKERLNVLLEALLAAACGSRPQGAFGLPDSAHALQRPAPGDGQPPLQHIAHDLGASPAAPERFAPPRLLSARQAEVLHLLKSGHSNKEIAKELGISEGTVKVQMKNIFRALGVRNRTEAAILASRQESSEARTGMP